MRRTQRISAGAIVIEQGQLLLVRYRDNRKKSNTFLAAPGGGVHMSESLPQAAIREVREETGLAIDSYPCKVLGIEELVSQKHKHVKIWLLCRLLGGELMMTHAAQREGIIQAAWYSREELADEVVYPSFVQTDDWEAFQDNHWQVKYLPPRTVNF